MKTVLENAKISTTASAEAKTKPAIWADKIELELTMFLELMMGNFETWNSNFRNEMVKRYFIDVITYQQDYSDKLR